MALIRELERQWGFVGSHAQQHWLWNAGYTKRFSIPLLKIHLY
ncbi:IS1 family transposase [Lonsdalea quercina]